MQKQPFLYIVNIPKRGYELKNQIFYTFIPLLKAGREDTEPMVWEAVEEAVKALSGQNEKL